MLFASFKYHISPSFPYTRIEQLRHVLEHNGASACDGEAWLKEVNLVVTNSTKFEGWEEVRERNELKQGEGEVYVVTDKWVDRSLVLGKIQSPCHYSPDPSLIFSGIIACATSLPPSDLEVLSAGITALGGQWRTGLTKDVTHLFAMSPDSQKYATAMHFREETGVKVILPHWFDDAVRLGMGGLSTDVYEWPDPEFLKNPLAIGKGGPESGVKKNMYAMAALFTDPSSSPLLKDFEVAAANRMEVDIWQGKKIVLSRTLQLFDRRREAVQAGIERAGGVVVRYDGDEEVDEGFAGGQDELSKREKERRKDEADKVLECDVLVTRWRDGLAYIAALRSHKTIGTLPWLFHVQSTGTLTRPLDQLLHYPVPKKPIEAFSNHVITVTNYTGEAREYIKKLIMAMGAKFTPSMSGQNTVLIAAYISGTKASKAQSWSIPIVNHTWLEDCFIQWRNLTVGLEKYIGFPNGVDFSTLLGLRGVGAVLEEGLDIEMDEVDARGQGEAPHGTDASVKEVQGMIVAQDVNMVDERTPKTYTKTFTTQQKANGQDTSPMVPTSSRISPKKTVTEPEEEEKANGKPKRKSKMNLVSSGDEEEVEPTRIQKKMTKKKKPVLSSEDEIENEEESEVEVVSSKAKGKMKGKDFKQESSAKKSKSKGKDDDEDMEMEEKVVSSKTKTTSKEKPKTAVKKRKLDDDDEDEEDKSPRVISEPKSKAKKTTTPNKYTTPTKPSISSKPIIYKSPAPEDSESSSEDELSLTPPARIRSMKLIRRVSGVEDKRMTSPEDEEEEEKAKPRLSLIEKTQLKKGDARTRVRKRKVEVKVPEEDEDEPVVVVVKSKGKTKAKRAKPQKGKQNFIQNSDDDEEPQHQSKKAFKKNASPSDDDDSEAHDSDSDLPAAPFLSLNKRSKKQVASTSASAPAPKSKSITKKAKTRPSLESEDEDDTGMTTPKRAVSVLMPSLNLSGNKKKKDVKPNRKKFSISSEEDEDRAITRTDSIRIMSNHQVQLGSGVKKTPSKSKTKTPPSTRISPETQKRSAATKASQRLHDTIMPDVVHFESQMRRANAKGRKSGGMRAFKVEGEDEGGSAGKRSQDGDGEEEERVKKKRRVEGKEKRKVQEEEEEDDEKVVSHAKTPSVMLLTTQVTLSDDVIRTLTKLGVKMTSRPSECTHLLAPQLVRTEKFLCALVVAPFILTAKWATQSAAVKKLLPEKDFVLHDVLGENKYDMDLIQSLRRAKKWGGKLLAGQTFYVTPKVPVDTKLLKNVVNACGGQVTTQQPTARVINASRENRHVISCKEDIAIWRPIAAQGTRIYSQELLLTGVLKQEMDWDGEGVRVDTII